LVIVNSRNTKANAMGNLQDIEALADFRKLDLGPI
jgi:hypothetical protein